MGIIRVIMQLLGFALTVYGFIVFFRVIMLWMPGGNFGRVGEMVAGIVDPYINWFRRFDFVRIGRHDFSVLAALMTVWIASNIALTIAALGRITLGIILAIIVDIVAGAILFFMGLFLVLAVIRFFGSLFGANTANRFWIVLDQVVEPLVHWVVSPFAKDRFISYQNALLIFSAIDLVALIAGRILVNLLIGLLQGLPF